MPTNPLLYPTPKSKIAHFFEELLLHSWWVILFSLLCYMTYEKEHGEIKKSHDSLHQQFMMLKMKKAQAIETQKKLRMQLDSQTDPAWIELTLMKELGLVPEGQVKVFFTPPQTRFTSPLRARKGITSSFDSLETKLNRLERGTPFPCGKGDEKGRFGEVAASPNEEVISLRALKQKSPVTCSKPSS